MNRGGFETKNYRLNYILAQGDEEFPWDPRELRHLQLLVEQTAIFGVHLDEYVGRPPGFEYDHIITGCVGRTLSPQEVWPYVFADVYKTAVAEANGIALLLEHSLGEQAFQLLRTLFECHVLCRYFKKFGQQDGALPCRYIVYDLIVPIVKKWEAYNELCDKKGVPRWYPEQRINDHKDLYEQVVGPWGKGKYPKDYAWAKKGGTSIRAMAKDVGTDTLFYIMASSEVHSTFGSRLAVSGSRCPVPYVPMIQDKVVDSEGEFTFEYQSATLLHEITSDLEAFITLNSQLMASWSRLRKFGKETLKNLRNVRGAE